MAEEKEYKESFVKVGTLIHYTRTYPGDNGYMVRLYLTECFVNGTNKEAIAKYLDDGCAAVRERELPHADQGI